MFGQIFSWTGPWLFEEVDCYWVILPGLVQLGLRKPLVHGVRVEEGHQGDVAVHPDPGFGHGGVPGGLGVEAGLQANPEHQVASLWLVETLQVFLQRPVKRGLTSSCSSGDSFVQ